MFPEELLSRDGEPIGSKINGLMSTSGLTKSEFYERFTDVVRLLSELDADLLRLKDNGRTLTEKRRDGTTAALRSFMSEQMIESLKTAYSNCPGEGPELPVKEYAAGLTALADDVQRMEPRTDPYFGLNAANEYRTVLERYMGEPISPQEVFNALDALIQTEAYALAAALSSDPEAARKKEPISFGSYEQNMAFLAKMTRELYLLPENTQLSVPPESGSTAGMDLMELAFRYYPGMAYLKIFADQASAEQKSRWDDAPDGYLAGLAVHCSHAVVPYLSNFGLDYVQYHWYEDMLYATMTGICALLIHYYGYTKADLTEYLKRSGAESFADVLYDKAMDEPFESLIASYGYYLYLDTCEACMDAGCDSEIRFLQDYLDAGPAPHEALKEYMVSLYRKQG